MGFSPDSLKNFKDEPWSEYGKQFRHHVIDVDDVDESDLLVELPKAVSFIHEGLQGASGATPGKAAAQDTLGGDAANSRNATTDGGGSSTSTSGGGGGGGVFVHCAAGKSRSVSVVIAYLLWRYPRRFEPNTVPPAAYGVSSPRQAPRSRKESARQAVEAALALIRRTRAIAEPNDGFMQQLALWWEMGCPDDVESHRLYQRWAYQREVEQHVAVGQAPSRLRFEDEQDTPAPAPASQQHGQESPPPSSAGRDAQVALRCKKCRWTLAASPFISQHEPAAGSQPGQPCPHYFIEPLGWMRSELEKGQLNGRLSCPNQRCCAAVGRYDWKGIRCACGGWVTPGLSLQRARVDEERKPRAGGVGQAQVASLGIRMPPGRGGNL